MTNKIKKRYNRIAGLYDMMEAPMEGMFSKWRKQMLKDASGKTLEVGIGTGKNIPYYPENVDLTGIDFSEKMISKAKEKVTESKNIQLLEMDAQQMQFDDNTFDTVVTSCVFCSVPDPVQGLKEIRRVCKDGGKILMLEHVRSNKKVVAPLMDAFNFIPLHLYGANINRETFQNLLRAGFQPENIEAENLWLDIVKLIRIINMKKNI
ncbi:MAG: methyltransferase domain-containing protein [Bacteroidales bacterium]|nr:class I SAM-dependent methyltransferase [Bacteroidales bacterium]NCU34452.1 class I SAM-dependent methyltransferase [Candidatus Falkowbacteria bacterium]NLO50815.1 class I SAM-dependent methyltransferase [Bacteroidales bacterium]